MLVISWALCVVGTTLVVCFTGRAGLLVQGSGGAGDAGPCWGTWQEHGKLPSMMWGFIHCVHLLGTEPHSYRD